MQRKTLYDVQFITALGQSLCKSVRGDKFLAHWIFEREQTYNLA
jgi:hypothetical protein